jgi:hypothetical protein
LFPSFLRNFQTEFIGFIVTRFGIYNAFIEYLKINLPPGKLPMRDLCSGSGEPAVTVFSKSNCFSLLTLSDKYPYPFESRSTKISYYTQSADVLQMDFLPGTYYTMFNSFHHFPDNDKLLIIQRIISSGSSAFFVEILEPTIFYFLKILFVTTVGNFFLTPFVQPFSLKRLCFTYILPINIFTIAYDGIISVLKSRSVQYYQILFSSNSDVLRVFQIRNGLTPLTVIHIQAPK